MQVKANIGDIFLIPIDEEISAIGQIAADNGAELYCVVFDRVLTQTQNEIPDLHIAKVILFAITLDAKLWHGHWPIVGNTKSNLLAIPKPIFKIETLKGLKFLGFKLQYEVVNLKRQKIRRANKQDKVQLIYKTTVAPVRLEKAVKAYYDVLPWDPDYDTFNPDYLLLN